MWSTDLGRLCTLLVEPHARAMMSLPNESRSSCCSPTHQLTFSSSRRGRTNLVPRASTAVPAKHIQHPAPAYPHPIRPRHQDPVDLEVPDRQSRIMDRLDHAPDLNDVTPQNPLRDPSSCASCARYAELSGMARAEGRVGVLEV